MAANAGSSVPAEGKGREEEIPLPSRSATYLSHCVFISQSSQVSTVSPANDNDSNDLY